ncbi:MAG: hypothetical protein WCU88_12490 [Elusimicrobiota bacterium]|jgi:hypothetical protein
MIATLWRFLLLPLLAASLGFGMPVTPKGFSFSTGSGLKNRIITPNGDSLNDLAIFTFSNLRDSLITGRIYDIHGKYVADMEVGPPPADPAMQTLQWNGKCGGKAVPGGIYVYVLEGEDSMFTGTLVVVR